MALIWIPGQCCTACHVIEQGFGALRPKRSSRNKSKVASACNPGFGPKVVPYSAVARRRRSARANPCHTDSTLESAIPDACHTDQTLDWETCKGREISCVRCAPPGHNQHAALDKIDRACDSSCHYTGDHTAQKVAWIAFLEQTIFQNMVLCMIITGYL